MKKPFVVILFILFAGTTMMYAQQRKKQQPKKPILTADFLQKWAKTNCKTAPNGEFYKQSEIQCPDGYCLPTKADFERLIKYPHRWSTSNNPDNINGMWFGLTTENVNNATDKDDCGCLFLPAIGSYYGNSNGKRNSSGASIRGLYWSGSKFDGDRTWAIAFSSEVIEMIGAWSYKGYCWDELPVRCIKK
jgi:uncharacterized protein (TIGR02145 family)